KTYAFNGTGYTRNEVKELTRGHTLDDNGTPIYLNDGYPQDAYPRPQGDVQSIPVFADFSGNGKTDIFHYFYSSELRLGSQSTSPWKRTMRMYQLLSHDGTTWQKIFFKDEVKSFGSTFESQFDNDGE